MVLVDILRVWNGIEQDAAQLVRCRVKKATKSGLMSRN